MKNILLLVSTLLIFAAGCSKEYQWDNPLDPLNNLPPTVTYFTPEDGAVYYGYAGSITLFSVTATDPNEGDSLIYCDYYLGDTMPPPLYEGHIPAYTDPINIPGYTEFFTTGTLQYQTVYYWKFIIYDNHGAAYESPVYHFTTRLE